MSKQNPEKHDILCNQRLIGITVLLHQQTANKTSSAKPKHSNWNKPKPENRQFTKTLLRHGLVDAHSIVQRFAAAAMDALRDWLEPFLT